jgi:hypothetical protein
MATYLQGVTDYVPQLQPYQPDLNLYANVLQTKQNQYDTAWKSLNKVYGQYFYSDLSRDTNIERKDEILKNIDFNLKRISGLDLSLDQNVSQAVQVFKPFYEDQFIMKDMAWTKNYLAQKQRADGLKNSNDEKLRAQYWDTGTRAMDYKREEFRNLSDEESLGFGNASYTNYVNVQKEALKLAKEAGLSIEAPPEFSKDGRWVIKKTNGDVLMEPLSKLFESTLGSDPAVQAVYQTQAYVNRKDYAYSNAAQFGGDQNAAEMKYLEDSYNVLKQDNQQRYTQLKISSQTYDAQIAAMEKAIKEGNAQPGSDTYLERLKEAKGINDSILDRVEAQNEQLSDKDGTATTSTGFQNPYGDIQSLRYKVDNGMASKLMQKDLNESAEIFAYQNVKYDIEANPYAVNEQKFQHEMAIADRRGQYMLSAAALRNKGERENNDRKWKLESGAYYLDEQTGQAVPFESMNYTYTDMSNKGKGDVTGVRNMKAVSESMMKQRTAEYALPWAQKMTAGLSELKKSGLISEEDINYILNGNTNRKLTLDGFNNKLSSTPNALIRDELGANALKNINNRFNYYLKKNNKLPQVQHVLDMTYGESEKLKQYTGILDIDKKWRIETSKSVESSFQSSLDPDIKMYGKYFYDASGNTRSEKEFYDVLGQKANFKAVELKNELNDIMKNESDYVKSRYLNQVKIAGRLPERMKEAYRLAQNDPVVKQYRQQKNAIVNNPNYQAVPTDIYNKILSAAGQAYGNKNIIAKAPPGIGRYGDKGTYNPGTGLYVPGITAIDVSTKGFGTKGNAYFQQFTLDHRGLDYNDPTKVAISFDGATKTAFDAAKDSDINSVGRALIDAIIAESKDVKSKHIHFSLGAQRIAANDANKGAMIFKPDMAWLKQYVGARDKEGNKTNLLDQDEANRIIQNGITVMADVGNFNNGLMRGSTMSPLDAIIDYDGQYTVEGPSGYSSYTISKNNYGTSQYSTELNWKLWDPNKNDWHSDNLYNQYVAGNSADALVEENLLDFDKQLSNYNKLAANGGR